MAQTLLGPVEISCGPDAAHLSVGLPSFPDAEVLFFFSEILVGLVG